MTIQTLAMIDSATDTDIAVARNSLTGLFHGVLYVNHPTPSGCDRLLPVQSDPVGYSCAAAVKEQFVKKLRLSV